MLSMFCMCDLYMPKEDGFDDDDDDDEFLKS